MEKDQATTGASLLELSAADTELIFPMTELVEFDVRDEAYLLADQESHQ